MPGQRPRDRRPACVERALLDAIRSPTRRAERCAEDWRERLLAELDESVRLRLMSDVPLGAMLSGGLDSSLIVALMARQMTEPVKTFSVGFAEAGESNELADARLVADALRHRPPRARALVRRGRRSTSPSSSGTSTSRSPTSRRSASSPSRELAAQHVTVALSGQGADELLGGYRKHRAAAIAASWKRLPGTAPGGRPCDAAARARTARPRSAERCGAADPVDAAARDERQPRRRAAERARARPARRARRVDARCARSSHARSATSPDDPLPAALYLDGQLGLVDDMLHYFDRASMAHSLEVRVPFLDHHLVELCATIPAQLKVRRLDTKHVLKHARARPGPGPDHRQAEDRLLQRGRRRLVPGADAAARSPTTCSGRTRATRSCSTGSEVERARQRARRRARREQRLRAALGPDARGLAVVVPPARSARSPSHAALNASPSPDAPTRSSRRRETRREPAAPRGGPRGADGAAADRGSSSTTARRTGRSSSPASLPSAHAWIRVLTIAGRRRRPTRRADRPGIRGGHRSPCRRSARRRRQPRRRHLVRARLLRALLARSPPTRARDRERQRLRAGGRQTWRRAARHGIDRLGRVARLPLGLPRRMCCRSSERLGWDGIDEFKANALGWRTTAFEELPFRHHRPEGERDGSAWRARSEPGHRRPLHGLPAVVPRPSLALAGSQRAGRARDDLGLCAGRAGARAAPGGRGRPRVPPTAAEHPPVAAQSSRGSGTPPASGAPAPTDATRRVHLPPARLLVVAGAAPWPAASPELDRSATRAEPSPTRMKSRNVTWMNEKAS